MRVIVPLAGPDFILKDGSLKAEIELNGEPLLPRVLNSRPWASQVKEYSFILADEPETRKFANNSLTDWYPKSVVTFISDYTCGAALSALAGMATSKSVAEPVIVDLADILYSSTLEPTTLLEKHANCGGIALIFKSDNPAYSYIRLDALGSFAEAVEKRVISNNASAGTYIFRDMATYLRALAFCLENQESQTLRNLFFVCPLLNGVKDQSKLVLLEPVVEVVDIKLEEK
ncbi:hypothetical protein N9O86_01160 [Planktomarina temperata]|nr:hypothetical protein [Planktomarina temperata]